MSCMIRGGAHLLGICPIRYLGVSCKLLASSGLHGVGVDGILKGNVLLFMA